MQEHYRKKFFDIIRSIVPESALALKLRELKWWFDERRNSRYYEIKNDVATLNLGGEIGQKIVFPQYNKVKPLYSHIDLPSYFQVPLIKEGSTVVDAGASPGDFTVVASKMVGPKGRIYAFEPDPDGRRYLGEMIKANDISNVTIIPLALDISSRKNTFFRHKMGLYDKRFNIRRYGQSIFRAEATSLDDFFKDVKVDVIKMDIEGAEINVINGAKRIIQEMNPAFIIASYHNVDGNPTSIKLEQILKSNYKNVKTLYKNHQTTYAYD